MTNDQSRHGAFTAKQAARIGIHALHGFHASKGYAQVASRVPGVGPALGLLVRGAGAVIGAVHGIKTVNE